MVKPNDAYLHFDHLESAIRLEQHDSLKFWVVIGCGESSVFNLGDCVTISGTVLDAVSNKKTSKFPSVKKRVFAQKHVVSGSQEAIRRLAACLRAADLSNPLLLQVLDHSAVARCVIATNGLPSGFSVLCARFGLSESQVRRILLRSAKTGSQQVLLKQG